MRKEDKELVAQTMWWLAIQAEKLSSYLDELGRDILEVDKEEDDA